MAFGSMYFYPQSQLSQKSLKEISAYLPEITITQEQFKIVLILQMAISAIFAVSGLGLLLQKEWGRRATLYFSFAMVIIAFVAVLFSGTVITHSIVQIIYPGIMIFYLTSKKIEEYFIRPKTEVKEESE